MLRVVNYEIFKAGGICLNLHRTMLFSILPENWRSLEEGETMSIVTTDSIRNDLKGVVDSVESLVGLEPNSQTSAQADEILGRLFAIIHRLNYLIQSRMGDLQNASPPAVSSKVADQTKATVPPEASSLLDEFDSIVQNLKDALAKVAAFLRAAQYSIGVQFPFSINVSISFTP